MSSDRAIAVLISADGPSNIEVDARDRSPYTHDALGGRPTFVGAWRDSIYLLARSNPEADARLVDERLLPVTRREPGPFHEPLLVTKIDKDFRPVDFTVEDLAELTTAELERTTTSSGQLGEKRSQS